jgi:hypothetical protein
MSEINTKKKYCYSLFCSFAYEKEEELAEHEKKGHEK